MIQDEGYCGNHKKIDTIKIIFGDFVEIIKNTEMMLWDIKR